MKKISLVVFIIFFSGCKEKLIENNGLHYTEHTYEMIKKNQYSEVVGYLTQNICTTLPELTEEETKKLNSFDVVMDNEIIKLYPEYNPGIKIISDDEIATDTMMATRAGGAAKGDALGMLMAVTIGYGLQKWQEHKIEQNKKILQNYDVKKIVKKYQYKKQQYINSLLYKYYGQGCTLTIIDTEFDGWDTKFFGGDNYLYRDVEITIDINKQAKVKFYIEEKKEKGESGSSIDSIEKEISF